MRTSVRLTLAAFAAAMFLGAAQEAKAVYAPQLIGVSGDLGGGVYEWSYRVVWGNNTTKDYLLTNGDNTVDPGTWGTSDFFTLYDVRGYVAGSASAGTDHTFDSANLVGINGPAQAPPDSASVINLTFRYTGTGQVDDATFTTFSFKSTVPGTLNKTLGWYSSQFSNPAATPDTKVGESGRVELPGVVPEPSSIALVGMGLAGLFGYGYRRRRQG